VITITTALLSLSSIETRVIADSSSSSSDSSVASASTSAPPIDSTENDSTRDDDTHTHTHTQYCWEEELLKVAKPLSIAPPTIDESLQTLKRDGVVRLNSSKFRIDENLCIALRNRILKEMTEPTPMTAKTTKKKKERYGPGTRLRYDSPPMDLKFGGDVRHDMLLPIHCNNNNMTDDDEDDNNDNTNDEKDDWKRILQPVLKSAVSQLEPLLLQAANELLPRLHGSNSIIRSSSSCGGDDSDDSVEVEKEGDRCHLSAELVEVAALIVRNGSGHQEVHGDYRRFGDDNEDANETTSSNKKDKKVEIDTEESFEHTHKRSGKMPPRIVTFVALQDIPSNEYGATGFITGTHTSQGHELIYYNHDNDGKESEKQKRQRQQDIIEKLSTNGVRTTGGFQCGEMLCYDASVLHWGGKNSIPQNDRVILYFGISQIGAATIISQSQPSLPSNMFEIVAPILVQDMIE